jgi:prominin 1
LIADTATIVVDKLEETSKAVSLKKLTTFAQTLPTIKSDLMRMKIITNDLRVNASQLSDGSSFIERYFLIKN